ncbi:hypothetical protein GCM10010174_23140 [Kutzneria viridogrisea]|uniref:Uncharacterized protein n=2 Tax=Kutzneria TaxID=43356 RepID=A0ABR6BWI5_9PSEU|nr:hypothetical protein [Kutzneria albida]AHH93776.1 putative secreted protein [Kutzneria albida DSM 43870]MBA8931220.1 hypothetical protein [Kutzneria viridogrisea]
MDRQPNTGAGRFRPLLWRAVAVLGGAFAGTALAWLLTSAPASAAPVPDQPATGSVAAVLDGALSALDAHPLLAGTHVLPTAPVVPGIQVGADRLVSPIVSVDQQLSRIVEHRPVPAPAQAAAPAHEQSPSRAERSAELAPVAVAPTATRPAPMTVAAVDQRQSASSAPVHPGQPDPGHGPTALPTVPLPGSSCGHDGQGGPTGCCLNEGPSVISGAGITRPVSAFGQRVPAATGRQPGVTPD